MHITSIAGACVALNGSLLFGLSVAITLTRRKTCTFFGYTVDPRDRLYRLVRAHGNTAEYAGVLCVLMWLASQSSPSIWTVSASLLATAGRFCQVIGMLVGPTMDAPPNALRLVGTTGTYVGGAGLCVAVLAGLL